MTTFQFTERMSGTFFLDEAPGVEHPVWFDVTAKSRGRLRLFENTLDLRGRVHAGPLTEAAPLTGTLVGRLRDHTLTYDVTFNDIDGRRMRLVGSKRYALRHPLRSATTLPVVVEADGRAIGRGTLRFEVRTDLLAWIGSFRVALL